MRIYKEIQQKTEILDSVSCDKCGKICNSKNVLDFQEWFHYEFIGGYYSIFGDSDQYKIDLCQQCKKELLGPYLKYFGNRNQYT